MIALSIDEQRVAQAIRRWAASYEKRASERPFGFDRVRAKALIKVAEAIENGKHR